MFLLLFHTRAADEAETDVVQLSTSSLPQIIKEIHKNVERTKMLRDYLNQITAEDLQKNKHLFDDLANVDKIIRHISDAIHEKTDDDPAVPGEAAEADAGLPVLLAEGHRPVNH